MKCPFKSQNGKCTNKGVNPKNTKGSTKCIYNSYLKCPVMIDWIESLKCTEDGLKSLRTLFGEDYEP